jgi:hypothetical protein
MDDRYFKIIHRQLKSMQKQLDGMLQQIRNMRG